MIRTGAILFSIAGAGAVLLGSAASTTLLLCAIALFIGDD